MNEKTGKFQSSSLFIGLVITIVTLLAIVSAWLFWSKAEDGSGALIGASPEPGTETPAEVRAQAEELAQRLQAVLANSARGEISVHSDPATGSLSTIRAGIGGDLMPDVPGGMTPVGKVEAFLAEHGAQFGIHDPANQLKRLPSRKDQYGFSHVSYQQMHGKVPVLGAVVKGHVSPDGRLTSINGKFVPGIDLPGSAQVSSIEAVQAAIARVDQQQPSTAKGVELMAKSSALVVYRTGLTNGQPGDNHLVYEVQVTGNQVREFVYIDALTGKLVDQISGIHGLKRRELYQGAYVEGVTPPVWQEGDLRPDPSATHEDEISGTGYSYNLFFNLSGGTYRSWDGNEATMITVDTDPTIVCPNANWNGTSTNYCIFTAADDVVAHEWAHAYTQETSRLIYSYQSGALNESYSDVFGETVDLINNRDQIGGTTPVTGNNGPRSQDDTVCSTFTSEIPTADESVRWLMGEDAVAFTPLPPVGDQAIRDMWRPRCAGGNFSPATRATDPRTCITATPATPAACTSIRRSTTAPMRCWSTATPSN